MELTLRMQEGGLVAVACEGLASHTFELRTVLPGDAGPPQPLEDPQGYGAALFAALFPADSTARHALDAGPERILLVAMDAALDVLPWEYLHGPAGFVILDVPFVRGVSANQRIATPPLDAGLHIVAVPSDPLDAHLAPLDIMGEWQRLAETVADLPTAAVLERVRPPTLGKLRECMAGQRQRVLHFMGHGGQGDHGAFLCFEQDDGALAPATAQEISRRVRGTTFLVTLNACVSATPGDTEFSNLAAALVRQGTPYALGMRFSVPDADARVFARAFYADLARGVPVEEALRQARLALADGPRAWVVGVPVLYTALSDAAPGFARCDGVPQVVDPAERLRQELGPIPRALGGFRGRTVELRDIGRSMTSDQRPRILTIHGAGGQGKTTLAREAVERFAWAWPGGVWVISIETLPSREEFVRGLARFLSIEPAQEPEALERQVLARLGQQQRTLLVLDNAETLVDAVAAGDAEARRLAQLVREQLPDPRTTLLVTSRVLLGWPGEEHIGLGGLDEADGAQLFRQSAPQRQSEIEIAAASELSRKVDGHPLSLRLLGASFNESGLSLTDFTADHEARLLAAQDTYRDEDHRHRSLYTSIETSVRYLGDGLRELLSGLWVFHAPFLPESAVRVFDPHEYPEGRHSPVLDQLHTLWRRGLLAREITTLREGSMLLYRLLPTVRPYAERFLPQRWARDDLLARFGAAYAALASQIHRELDRNMTMVYLAQQAREDLDRGLGCAPAEYAVHYALDWGEVLSRLGNRRRALELAEQALEAAEGYDQHLALIALNNIALVYRATGQPQRALQLYEQTLPIMREVGDRAGEATTLNNMAAVHSATGQPQRAFQLFEQALTIRREVGDRAGEATTLTNLAVVHSATGQPQRALQLYEQTLPIMREVGNRAGEAATLTNLAAVHSDTGQAHRALQLYEQALPIMREVGNRAGEAATLNNIALVYHATGEAQRALQLFEQALALRREVGDRAGEATTLNNMAAVHSAMGQAHRALQLLEQALPIMREVGNRAGEATTLTNMAAVYRDIAQSPRALQLYEQALALRREVGNRAGEATTLNNMAVIHNAIGQPQRALQLYEQALALRREVGDRAGEATTLNNMAAVSRAIGQPQRALQLYEQTLPIMREVGDHAGEATTLNSLAYLLVNLERFAEALPVFEESIALERAVQHRAGEITGLIGAARLLYQYLARPADAIALIEQAVDIFERTRLPQDAAGQTVGQVHSLRDTMRAGQPLDAPGSGSQMLPDKQLRVIVTNTIAVLTELPERRAEWRIAIEAGLDGARQRGTDWQIEVDLYSAVLSLLDGQAASLLDTHPYAPTLAAIQRGLAGTPAPVAAGVSMEAIVDSVRAFVYAEDLSVKQATVEQHQVLLFRPEVELLFESNIAQTSGSNRELLELHLQILRSCKRDGIAATFQRLTQPTFEVPFDPAIIPQSVAALRGTPAEKLAHAQALMALATQSNDPQLTQLVQVIQTALFGANPAALGDTLEGEYRTAWESVVAALTRDAEE